MLSAAYQQSHEISEDNLKLDPTNRFVWHFQPRRLEAELIRDSLLSVSGQLDRKMYGPSVLEDAPRRSVYLRVKRSELIPFMTMFDAPEPTQSIGERTCTTVPTQALAMMNSPFVRQQAEKLAARIRPTPEVPLQTAIDQAYRICFARVPTDAERATMLEFLSTKSAEGTSMDDARLVEFCQVLLSLNEFVYID